MKESGMIPLFFHTDVEVAKKVLKACYDGGARLMEFTNRGDFALEVFTELTKYAIKDLPAKMLLQVHDELLFEVKEEFSQDLVDKVQSIMETASLPFLKMDIPLSVDAGHGLNWAEAH